MRRAAGPAGRCGTASGPGCETVQPRSNTGFANAATRLNMAVELGGEKFDRDDMRFFKGTRRACTIRLFGLADCCRNDGLLEGLAGCSASERELARERHDGKHPLSRQALREEDILRHSASATRRSGAPSAPSSGVNDEFLPRLTLKGHFGRDMVASMREAMTWPGMEATEQFRAGKALREGDVWELHLLHRMMDLAGLIEGRAVLCQLTPLGREMLEPERRGALQAVPFRQLYWHANLSQFVETFPRGLPGRWPQDDIGVILWGLSTVGGEWQSADTLRTLATVRDDSVAGLHWNAEGTMFAGRVLGLLRWFGLLEYHGPPERFEVGWRKTALFDRFLSFDVHQLSQERGTGH